MNKKLNYIVIIILLIVFTSTFFTSCEKNEEVPIEKYFNYLRKLEYPRIYTMLSQESKSNISLDDFCNRYDNIYSAISVNSMTYDLISTDYIDNVCHVFFILNIKSNKLGDFLLNISATFIKENNKWTLDWEPSLLLPGMSDDDVVRITSTPAERGEIFDKNG